MKISLNIEGVDRTFTLDELKDIIKKWFEYESEKITVPRQGQWYYVNPSKIDRTIFKKPRMFTTEENLRKHINEAFEELDKNFEKYAQPFEIMLPTEDEALRGQVWYNIVSYDYKACRYGGNHIADWVEQALEWAQRIQNGETWTSLCRIPDKAKNYRSVKWKNGNIVLVGGVSSTYIINTHEEFAQLPYMNALPLCVRYVK